MIDPDTLTDAEIRLHAGELSAEELRVFRSGMRLAGALDENRRPILARLRRKLDVLHTDLRRENDRRYHDVAEALALLDILEGKQ